MLVIEIYHSISQNTLSFLVEKIFDFKVDRCPKLWIPIPSYRTHNLVTFHRMWPRKYGWLNFAILECSLDVWVNKAVFAAPDLRQKCAAKSEGFSSLPKITAHKPFLAEISNINIFHITQYFWVKRYVRNQWNLPNILAYISGIFDDFFKGGLVPLKVRHTKFRDDRLIHSRVIFRKPEGVASPPPPCAGED